MISKVETIPHCIGQELSTDKKGSPNNLPIRLFNLHLPVALVILSPTRGRNKGSSTSSSSSRTTFANTNDLRITDKYTQYTHLLPHPKWESHSTSYSNPLSTPIDKEMNALQSSTSLNIIKKVENTKNSCLQECCRHNIKMRNPILLACIQKNTMVENDIDWGIWTCKATLTLQHLQVPKHKVLVALKIISRAHYKWWFYNYSILQQLHYDITNPMAMWHIDCKDVLFFYYIFKKFATYAPCYQWIWAIQPHTCSEKILPSVSHRAASHRAELRVRPSKFQPKQWLEAKLWAKKIH